MSNYDNDNGTGLDQQVSFPYKFLFKSCLKVIVGYYLAKKKWQSSIAKFPKNFIPISSQFHLRIANVVNKN